MIDYTTKSYGRNQEVRAIYKLFSDGRDVAMPGPRRLGKTFVLDRLVEAAPTQGWQAVKAEVSGYRDVRAVFRALCEQISRQRSRPAQVRSWVTQRLGQVVSPRSDHSGPWSQFLLKLDHEDWFERQIKVMNDDTEQRWLLLIDELPIFLKSLHDQGPDGVAQARDFMNQISRLRQAAPRVRWLITGSIGIEPLARAGQYLGVLAKFHLFELEPLSDEQARDFVQDLARSGQLAQRSRISDAEAKAIVDQVGWRAAYYLDAVAQKLAGDPSDDPQTAAKHVQTAVDQLLDPRQGATFGTWEEHLRKHYHDADRGVAFAALGALSPHSQGLSIDTLLAAIGVPALTRGQLQTLLSRLHTEGFITLQDWSTSDPSCAFRNPLLRRWWHRFPPQPTA